MAEPRGEIAHAVRALALMCGAGVLPARMAREARRQGWRVVAFAFADGADVKPAADVVVPSRLTELGPIFEALARERISAAVFSGKFWIQDILALDAADADASAIGIERRAASRADFRLTEAVVSTLGGMGVEVLDPRTFVGDWLATAQCWSARTPTEVEWADVRVGLRAARLLADHGIGQTAVVRHGAVTAVEAAEGTTETIRRGAALAGPGAVVVKTTARRHDYRLDLPTIGLETIEVAAAGGAAVVAVEAGRVLVLDRAVTARRADGAGIALVGVDDDAPA